jgi:hypothetical protein
MESDKHTSDQGAYIEAGEAEPTRQTVTAELVARAFGVDRQRVVRALEAEFDLGPDARIDERTAHELSELLLTDQPLDKREAAMMRLGVFTPRRDAVEGIGSGPPGEESDRLSAEADVPPDVLASKHSSYAPSTTDSG